MTDDVVVMAWGIGAPVGTDNRIAMAWGVGALVGIRFCLGLEANVFI